MKVARLYSFGDIRIEDAPVPRVGPGQALMRTRASGVCSGEVMPWYIEKKAPLVLGHEPSGEIVEVGEGVSSFKVGDRVFAHHHAPCFGCRHCWRGDFVHCAAWKDSSLIPGGLSEYILIPESNLLNDTLMLPDGVSFEDGTLVEPLACVLKGLKRAETRHDDIVLVIGLGFMGMLHVLVLKEHGAARVIGADTVPFRLGKAAELGADFVIDASKDNTASEVERITEGRMADVVIVGPGSTDALLTGIRCAAPGASVLMFTPVLPGETLTIEPNELYFKDISLITSYSAGPTDTADALELIESGIVRAEILVTHRFGIEDAEKAYRLTAEARDSLKCLVVF